MNKMLIVLVLGLPIYLAAQDKGIIFENNISWKGVLEKAKAENKYIFIDCSASWCGL